MVPSIWIWPWSLFRDLTAGPLVPFHEDFIWMKALFWLVRTIFSPDPCLEHSLKDLGEAALWIQCQVLVWRSRSATLKIRLEKSSKLNFQFLGFIRQNTSGRLSCCNMTMRLNHGNVCKHWNNPDLLLLCGSSSSLLVPGISVRTRTSFSESFESDAGRVSDFRNYVWKWEEVRQRQEGGTKPQQGRVYNKMRDRKKVSLRLCVWIFIYKYKRFTELKHSWFILLISIW